MKSYYIHLFRNGLTDNPEGKYIGHTDVALSEDGIKQLNQMKKDFDFPPVEAVFSSPLQRSVKTAEIFYPDIKPIIINDLIEYNFGEFEGRSAEDEKDNPLFARWLAGEQGVEPPFGESNEAFAKRICNAFEKIVEGIMKTGTTKVAVFTHGGVIMSLLAAYGIPEAPMHEWLTPNGCGYSIRINPMLWMSGKKFEVYAEAPYLKEEQ